MNYIEKMIKDLEDSLEFIRESDIKKIIEELNSYGDTKEAR